MIKRLKRLWLYPIVVLFIVFEEVIYRHLIQPTFRWLRLTTFIHWLNQLISQQNRYVVLIMFVGCFGIGELLGLASLTLFASGHFVLGITTYAIKTLLALYAFMLLETQKEKLFSFVWFTRSYQYIMRVITRIKTTLAYQEIHHLSHRIRSNLNAMRHGKNLLKRLYHHIKMKK